MNTTNTLPDSPRSLKKWQLALLGMLQPSSGTLNFLFPPGQAYSKLARAVVLLALRSLQRSTLKRLVGKRYIVPTGRRYLLTPLGRRYTNDLVGWFVSRSPSRWDGKWRVVIFDVPETRKRDRDLLRRLLQRYGFKKLQASVWVSPYVVPHELNQQLWGMKLKYHVLYLLVTKVDYDRSLGTLFPGFGKG